MKLKYQNLKLNESSSNIIKLANGIIKEYIIQGYSLTLRQLYYQFVARDLLENTQRSYKNLGNTINKGRLAGLIDWDYIEDTTRKLNKITTWENPEEIMNSVINSYCIDLWENSDIYIEVWVEKDALINIVEKSAFHYQVPCFSCRGYVSQSAMWQASLRFRSNENDDKKCYLLHLGDHDPSGIDMSRDVAERLKMFHANIKLIRIALNMDQIEKYNPPPNPAKITDPRYETYIEKFGHESWELDALEPIVIEKIIKKYISKYMNKELYLQAKKREQQDIERLSNILLMMENGEL